MLMNSFKEYVSLNEEKEIEQQIDEDVLSFIGSALGFTVQAVAYSFGGALLVLGGAQAVKGMKTLWDKIKETVASIRKPKDIIKDAKADPKVHQEIEKVKKIQKEYEDELHGVYSALSAKDFDLAKQEFDKLDKSIQNMTDIHRVIIAEITRVLGEPPIYVTSPGNKTYQMIKKILNIRTARAAAKATELVIKKSQAPLQQENNLV
jgi:hypothetical protein